jgi:hypothetical protein
MKLTGSAEMVSGWGTPAREPSSATRDGAAVDVDRDADTPKRTPIREQCPVDQGGPPGVLAGPVQPAQRAARAMIGE